jgi:hypothetical protein
MPASMLAMYGDWIHLCQYPSVSIWEKLRAALLRRVFYYPGSIRMPAGRAGDFDRR